ncbi:MAG: HAMP domain-containing protein [Sphingobacteriia bacterium]|nr:HAMP domain-containing protein [Sphingobacteriia bacterium]
MRPSLSIHAKVFLTLLLAAVLVLVGTQSFVRWSLQQGLIELAEAREQARIQSIAERLTELYARTGDWSELRASRRLWVGVLLGRNWTSEGRREREGHGEHQPHWMRRFMGPERDGNTDARFNWPPAPLIQTEGRLADSPLELRLMLLDASGGIVYGRPELLPEARRFPLELDGLPIGELVLIAGPPVADLAELNFIERQGGRLWLIAAAMLALTAVLAYPLSRRLVRPVQAFQRTARRLAAGDFSARVPVCGRDEIARLGNDINALASALEQNEEARRQWVADLSHELRTPIALLRARLEAMQDGVRPLDQSGLGQLHQDLLRLSRLVDDLNELAKTHLGALTYRMHDLDLLDLLRADVASFEPRFTAAGLSLALENRLGQAGGAPLRGDPDRLSQLVHNLLLNSLSYTDRGGGLTIGIEPAAGGHYLIRFADTAPGVPSAALPRLFDRLYRVEGSRSRHTGGAGLGLAIARNVVQAHGGTIEARAAAAGGVEIRILLPGPGAGPLSATAETPS